MLHALQVDFLVAGDEGLVGFNEFLENWFVIEDRHAFFFHGKIKLLIDF